MTLPLNIQGIVAVVNKLNTDLPAEIAATNALITSNAGNGWPQHSIEMPQVHNHMPSIAELLSLPAIGIGEGNVDFEDDVGWSATGRYDLAVVLYIRSLGGREELVWRLRYTAMAVATVVLSNRDVGAGWGLILQRIEPGPILRERENADDGQPQARSNTVLGLRTLLFNLRDEQDA